MRVNILIGGRAGQGINKAAELVSGIVAKQGYFIFNYNDYPSLIRGGHKFNVISVSDKRVGSIESRLDIVAALDEKTVKMHLKELKENGTLIEHTPFDKFKQNANSAMAGAIIKVLGISKEVLMNEVKEQLNNDEAVRAAEQGYDSQKEKWSLKQLNNNVTITTGTKAIAQGAIDSGIDVYMAYPMTPATGVFHELAEQQFEQKIMVFQPESEIAVINAALGASFAGAKTMVGSSGGGFDLMTEGLSLQGMTEIPLVVYLASRSGPATGVPTYTSQAELDIALKAGHGEFPRVVVAPGDPIECIEKTNEACYLAEKWKVVSLIVSDKHLAESEFSCDNRAHLPLKVEMNRRLPENGIVKASSYEHDEQGNTTESAELIKSNADRRMAKMEAIKKECEQFEMYKLFGKKDSKNLLVSWGSNKTVILDATEGLDCRFLQVIYIRPLSTKIKEELEKATKIILIENNATGQLGNVLAEEFGIKIKDRILKYDARPFYSDSLREEIKKRLR